MPTGPQGQKRPADLVGCVHRVFQIAVGEAEEEPTSPHRAARAAAGKAGGNARAKKLTATRRREIAQEGVKARLTA